MHTPKPKPKPMTGPLYPVPTKTRIAPLQSPSEAAKQDKALKDLMKRRAVETKRTGVRPNYYTD